MLGLKLLMNMKIFSKKGESQMKILHYTLGFGPSRTGGLVKYANDVMEEQSLQGEDVYALFPNGLNFFKKGMYIRKKRKKGKIKTFELVNSFPLPLVGGIKRPSDFMKKCSEDVFKNFLSSLMPDVIHVHTLMGIPREFFIAAKKKNIRIVFSTNDYFGLAPSPDFFYDHRSYDKENTAEYWKKSSNNALSTARIRVFQLKTYPLIRKILKKIKKSNQANDNVKKNYKSAPVSEYRKLMDYYRDIFALIDKFHFNSTVAENVYRFNLQNIENFKVISITNKDIGSQNFFKKTKNKKVRVAYIGPDKFFKGFFDFLKLTKMLDNNDYEFYSYGYDVVKKIDNINQQGRYSSKELKKIYIKTDILVVPSKWKETFGFVALEAMSYNTTVFISENVGAKDLLDKKYEFTDMGELANKIKREKSYEKKYNLKTIDCHVRELKRFYTSY